MRSLVGRLLENHIFQLIIPIYPVSKYKFTTKLAIQAQFEFDIEKKKSTSNH